LAAGVLICFQWTRAIRSAFDDYQEYFAKTRADYDEYIPEAFNWLFALFMTTMAVWMVGYAEDIKAAPRHFLASCKKLLLHTMPLMVGFAWRSAFKVSLWDRVKHEDPNVLLRYHFEFTAVASFGVVCLTRIATDFHERAHSDLENHSFGSGYHRWHALFMTCRASSVFMAWCWHSLAKTVGEAMEEDMPHWENAENWSRGIYAVLVSLFFAWTTVRTVSWFKEMSNHREASLDHREAYKRTWSDYFKLVGSTKGWMVGWAWGGFFEHLLLGRIVNGVLISQSVYLGIVVVMGTLITSHMARFVTEQDEHQASIKLELLRLMLHTAGMMTGNAVDNWTVAAFPSQGEAEARVTRATVCTLAAVIVYHATRRVGKASDEKDGDDN